METLAHYIVVNKNKSIIFFLVVLLIIYIGLKISLPDSICGEYLTREVVLSDKTIKAEIADNDCKRTLGLSGRKNLLDDQGMLFVFEKVGKHEFWMKDMNFSIDILWLDENFKIVGIEKTLTPSTFPKIYGSNYLSKYVLEINSELTDELGIKVGKIISIDEK